ncbi:coiled-coil domain-containing protein [Thermaerobacillus caldiproteolyticus]|uniref:AAA family ATPase n=1 Tax=Thermaerobacillus caldiproteolyticus TaxID=247480 RepID=UPI001F32663D|nr:AAA family ATPase [Anoxybacillus caldiproteolyticus]
MFIEAVKIRIVGKSGKVYGRYLNFLDGNKVNEISMIYGKNTLGKSTLINSIVYGLNGEDIFKKKKKNPINFHMILERFMNDSVKSGEIYLQLYNQNKRVVILRDAIDEEEAVIVFDDVSLDEKDTGKSLDKKAPSKQYYKMRKDKKLNGNKTYQEFLFSFLNIDPLRKITDEDKEEGLIFYIQNLIPLFVITQDAWTDIQANNPRYTIKAVKETAFEIIMNLSSSHVAKYEHLLEIYKSQLRHKNNSINDVKEVVRLLKYDNKSDIEKEIDKGKNLVKELQKKIAEIENGRQVVDNVLSEIRANFKHTSLKVRRYEQSLELLEREMAEYEYYINKIQYDIEKYDKLKVAKKLIGIIPIERCPRCLNNIIIDENAELLDNHCSLCGSEMQNIEYTTETLEYLKDELSDFKRLLFIKEEKKKEIEGKLTSARLELKEIKNQMDEYEEALKPKNLEQYHYYSREIGRIQNTIKELEKDKEIIGKFKKLEEEKKELINKIDEIKEKKKSEEKKQEQDRKKISFFEKEFKKMLFELEFLKKGFEDNKIKEIQENLKRKNNTENIDEESVITKIYKSIEIDTKDYYPKIEGVNLYNITSSSGLIRIILSYYVALLKTALEFNPDTNHPFVLILDEPRQQNLDIETFNKFLSELNKLKKEYPQKFQVILASSDKGSCNEENIRLHLHNDNYLLKELDE